MTLPSILRLWINENVNNVKSLDNWRKFDHNHWLGKILGFKLMTVVADWYSGSIYLQFPGNECLSRSLRSSNLTVYPTEYVYSFVMLYSVQVKLLFGVFFVFFFFFFLGGVGGGGVFTSIIYRYPQDCFAVSVAILHQSSTKRESCAYLRCVIYVTTTSFGGTIYYCIIFHQSDVTLTLIEASQITGK